MSEKDIMVTFTDALRWQRIIFFITKKKKKQLFKEKDPHFILDDEIVDKNINYSQSILFI